MIVKHLVAVCLLFVLVIACAPVTSDSATSESVDTTQSADSDVTESSETTHEGEGEHGVEEHGVEEHGVEEHGNEEVGEHSHEEDEHGEGERRELGAHEHGAAELMIAWSGSEIAIDLQTPAYNILGFEYAPTSDEEKALLAESITILEEGSLLQFSTDAACTVVSAIVKTGFSEEGHTEADHAEEGQAATDHSEEDSAEENHAEEGHDEADHDSDKEGHHAEEGHDEAGHTEETHSDIDVAYNLECEAPENIASMDASELFEQFPNFAAIQVQWISETQQSAADLTLDNPVLFLN